jgi:RNA polymerase sigma-70 factor (ECF subfamily)
MTDVEIINACLKQDKTAQKLFFDRYWGKLGYVAMRYSKGKSQSNQLLTICFDYLYSDLYRFDTKKSSNLDAFVYKSFITRAISFIKNIRSEYFVSSTALPTKNSPKNFDLFTHNNLIDLKKIDKELLLVSIQELVPVQRLVFNMFVVDGFTMAEISELLESSEQSVKANLEKARFNIQKSIEKHLKDKHYEQFL